MSKIVFTCCAVFLGFCSAGLPAQPSEPTAQPTNMVFSNLKPYSLTMSFTGATADGYMVLKGSQEITDVPTDGIAYQKGQGLSSCKVMALGTATSFNVREVLEGTKYYFKVFAYNGSGDSINYLQLNPLIDSVVTQAADAGSYYSNIDPGSASFVSDLHNLIHSHTMIPYTNYRSNIVPAIYEHDTINGQEVVYCEYSNEITIYTAPFDFTAINYSREHTLCKSWMRTHPLYGEGVVNYPEGADYYNLLLTKLNNVNNIRSDNPEGIVLNAANTYKECKSGTDTNGIVVFEPRNDRKGDLARCMMYEMVCYNGLSGSWGLDSLLSFAPQQDQNVLKLWNQQDPPDEFEKTKNEYIHSIQNNRNPFIDHPDWADCIDFDNITKSLSCIASVKDETPDAGIKLFPNPAAQYLDVDMANEYDKVAFEIYDISGRRLAAINEGMANGVNTYQIPLNRFQNGNYILKITDGESHFFRKFTIVN